MVLIAEKYPKIVLLSKNSLKKFKKMARNSTKQSIKGAFVNL